MIYDRYINNKIIIKCRRPQRHKWCGPTTVAEIIEILLEQNYSIDNIAKIMEWSENQIIGGNLGTQSIIRAIQKVSNGKIKTKIIYPRDQEEDWKKIKQHIHNNNKVLYYHEPGHHVLISGFIEEPLIEKEDLGNHQNVNRSEYSRKRKWLIKAEHNIKTPIDVDRGMLVPVDYSTICCNIRKNKNLNLVITWI